MSLATLFSRLSAGGVAMFGPLIAEGRCMAIFCFVQPLVPMDIDGNNVRKASTVTRVRIVLNDPCPSLLVSSPFFSYIPTLFLWCDRIIRY